MDHDAQRETIHLSVLAAMTDLVTIAHAYRCQRQAGKSDHPAYQTAFAAYRDRHPETELEESAAVVSRLIHHAGEQFAEDQGGGSGATEGPA